MDREREPLIEQSRRPGHDPRTEQIERALEGVSADQKDGEGDQSGHALAAQHSIVDLQHVEGTGEHQQVHDAREEGNAAERAPTFP